MKVGEGSGLFTRCGNRHRRHLELQRGQLGAGRADRYTDEIRDACEALAVGRRKGRTLDVRPGYLKLSTGSHMIYFRDSGDRLEIIRILHGSQDVERHL